MYLSLNGVVIPNHGYVLISDIGSTNDMALLCHTNCPPTTNSNGQTNSGGDWFGPDRTRVNDNCVPGFRRNRGPMVVRLYRATLDSLQAVGIYHCEIEDDNDTAQTVFVGLYNEAQGTDCVVISQVYYLVLLLRKCHNN